MPPINASVTNQQITASVGETQIDVTVTGGVGPTGPQGPAGVSYTLPNATTSTLGGVIVGSGLSVSSGTVSANVTSVAGRTGAVTIAAADVSGLGSLATQSSLAYSSLTGKPTTLSGYGITDAVGSSDSRLTNSREWSASTASQSEAETGTSTSRLAFTPQRIFQAIAAWWAASSSKTKLDGIATGATANSSDATLLSRANHTGTQSAGTITGLATVATSGAYSDLSGRPTLDFAASSHSHEISSVNGLQTALDGKQATGSYATLVGGTVPSSQLPSYVDDVLEFASVGNFPATGESGKIFVATSSGKVYRWSGSAYVEISPSPGSTDSVPEGSVNLYHTTARAAAAAPVQTVSGKTGSVILSSSDVGLGNVDNTSDVNKPISTATQTAINGKASASHAHGNLTNAGAIGTASGQIVVTTTGGVVTAASSISSSAVSGLATVATSGSYADLSNKPATFTPSSHTHTASAITDFSSAVDAKLTTQTAYVSFASITMYDVSLSGDAGMTLGYKSIDGITSLSFGSGGGTQTTAWTGAVAISGVTGLQAALDGKQASGNYATLVGGTVPSSQLPSYVDDVLEFASFGAFPATGESGKIFVATGTGKIYRWSGSTYIEISPSPGSTDSISEGSVNLYHTTARAAAAAPVQSVAGRTGAVTIAATDVSGLGSLATQSSVSYSALTDKPATFAPSSHTHTASAITDFDSAVASASPAEVLEYTTSASFPATGSTGKLYVATDSSRAYRWTGAAYAEVGPAGAYLPTHTHAASDIVSGVVATARLGSGTASSSTFLRGDQSWYAPTASDVSAASQAAVYEFTRSTKPAAATGSNGSYTFTLPSNAKVVEFLAIGAGGGGGSGRRGAAGTARYGGGGGGGGNATLAMISASQVTTSLTITVGSSGAGGAAVTADDTSGNNGSVGGQSQITYNGTAFIVASPGSGGGGGTASSGTNGSSASNNPDTWRNNAGVGASSVSAAGGSAFVAPGYAACGGAAGGGISTGNTAYGGGTQYLPSSQVGLTGQSLTNQTAGSASTTAAGGDGPSGPNYGHGGCGGGASANGFNSGKGGNGGDGYVRVTVWF